jgi:hypothetical protein
MSTSRFDWRRVEWKPEDGRGGFVPKYIKRLPLAIKTAMCRRFGHPIEAIERFTWIVEGKREPGFICARCYGRVELDRILSQPKTP